MVVMVAIVLATSSELSRAKPPIQLIMEDSQTTCFICRLLPFRKDMWQPYGQSQQTMETALYNAPPHVRNISLHSQFTTRWMSLLMTW